MKQLCLTFNCLTTFGQTHVEWKKLHRQKSSWHLQVVSLISVKVSTEWTAGVPYFIIKRKKIWCIEVYFTSKVICPVLNLAWHICDLFKKKWFIGKNHLVLNLPTDDGGEKNEKRMFPSYDNNSSKCLLFKVLTKEIDSVMAFYVRKSNKCTYI